MLTSALQACEGQVSARPQGANRMPYLPERQTHRSSGPDVGLTCEGVHKGGQRPVQHLEEGIPARVLLGATQDRVLENMGNPSAVHGGGAELHATARETGRVR